MSLWYFCSPRLGISVCSWRHAVICILVSNCCAVRPGQERQLGFQAQTATGPSAPQAQPGLSPGVLPGPLLPEAHAAAGNGLHGGYAAPQPDGQPRGPLQDALPGSIGVASSSAASKPASGAESAASRRPRYTAAPAALAQRGQPVPAPSGCLLQSRRRGLRGLESDLAPTSVTAAPRPTRSAWGARCTCLRARQRRRLRRRSGARMPPACAARALLRRV